MGLHLYLHEVPPKDERFLARAIGEGHDRTLGLHRRHLVRASGRGRVGARVRVGVRVRVRVRPLACMAATCSGSRPNSPISPCISATSPLYLRHLLVQPAELPLEHVVAHLVRVVKGYG